MKIVRFKDGGFAVRKWAIIYWYADKDNFSKWGWWSRSNDKEYKVNTIEEAEALLEIVKAGKDSGEVI